MILLVILFYIVYSIVHAGASTYDLVPRVQSLDEKKDILYPDETQKLLLGNAGSTVMGRFITLLSVTTRSSTLKKLSV